MSRDGRPGAWAVLLELWPWQGVPRWLPVALLVGAGLMGVVGWDSYDTLSGGGRARLSWFELPAYQLGGRTGLLVLYVVGMVVLTCAGVMLLVLRRAGQRRAAGGGR